LAPLGCLLMAVYSTVAIYLPDVQHYVETFIYLAASFSFALHNFRFKSRFHWILGSICSFISGAFIVLFCSMLAIRGDLIDLTPLPFIYASETIFIVCWSAALYAFFARCRRLHSGRKSEVK
jgi:hypothetical protein